MLVTAAPLVSVVASFFVEGRPGGESSPPLLDAGGRRGSLVPAPRLGVAFALVVGALTALLISLPDVDAWPWRVGHGVAVFALAISLGPVALRRRGVTVPLGLAVVLSSLSALLIKSYFAKLAIISGSIAGLCGAAAVVALMNPQFTIGRGGAVTTAALIPTVALIGYSYDYDTFSPACWILVSVAMIMLWVGELPIVRKRRPWAAGAIRLAAVLIPCAVALAIALWPHANGSGAPDYLDYASGTG